jgi:hypothetical protein
VCLPSLLSPCPALRVSQINKDKSMVVMTSMCRNRRFCATHRAEEHVPVVRKRCKHSEGCDGYAYYGCPGSDKRMYCSVHRGEAGVPLKQTCTYLG